MEQQSDERPSELSEQALRLHTLGRDHDAGSSWASLGGPEEQETMEVGFRPALPSPGHSAGGLPHFLIPMVMVWFFCAVVLSQLSVG